MVFGTVGYMSPEQASGESADYRGDQFAFGAILYEMATGSRAFQKETSAETLSMIIRGDPERPLDLNPSLPLPLVWTIERCLSKGPRRSLQSTRDLARDLQTLRDYSGDWHGLDAPVSRRGYGARGSSLQRLPLRPLWAWQEPLCTLRPGRLRAVLLGQRPRQPSTSSHSGAG